MIKDEVAKILLNIKAVELNPTKPFTWVSGIKSPIYCDNRLLMSYPIERKQIVNFMVEKIKDTVGVDNFDVICGTASSAIPHAAWLAEKLNKPMIYVRKKSKGYGQGKQVEGVLKKDAKVLLVEDLISTGGSSINGIESIRQEGGECMYCLAIFTYEMDKSKEGFKDVRAKLITLSDFSTLVKVAFTNGFIKQEELQPVLDWNKNPHSWAIEKGFIKKIKLPLGFGEARKKVCLPLDNLHSLEEVKLRIDKLSPYVGMFKIGKELFTRFGPEVINLVKKSDSEVFLDLKYCDIPNTVKLACKAAAELGVSIITIHSFGGLEMMQAAMLGVKEGVKLPNKIIPKVIAVTVLTSFNEKMLNDELNITTKLSEQIIHLSNLAIKAGCDGVVCSAADLSEIKDKLPKELMVVTPGIKGPNTPAGDDQKRVYTPGKAIEEGSSLLVIGRAITAAEDMEKAAMEVLEDIRSKRVLRIDPHVHFRDEEQKHLETIKHGLELARKQGVEYVFDMPNTVRPILRQEDVKRRLAIVSEINKHRYFIYMGATKEAEQLKEAAWLVKENSKVIGIKMYAGRSTGDLAILKEDDQRLVYKTLVQEGYLGVLAVHCEKESCMTDTFTPDNPISHAESRPNKAEVESLKDQIKFAKEAGFKGVLHICHISTPQAVELVNAEKNNLNIVCGVTPHHLMWDDQMLNLPNGLLYKMNPPLRKKEDVLAMRELIKQGKIDWIETDHAPHQVGEKLHGGCPSGYPSLYLYKDCIENLLPSLGLSKEEISKLTFDNIVESFGLDF